MANSPKARPSDPVVLFVDDDPDQLDLYARLFSSRLSVLTAPSGLHALDLLSQATSRVCLVVSDYSMPGMTGIALLAEVLRLYPHIGRVLLSGSVDSELVLEAKAHKVLTKGMSPDLIRSAILREARRHGG